MTPATPNPVMEPAQTLVGWCLDYRLGVDVVRREIRRTPALQALGTPAGPNKVYSRAEMDRIAAAVRDRRTPAREAAPCPS